MGSEPTARRWLWPSYLDNPPDIIPRTVCLCQPIRLAISSIVAPFGRCNRTMIWACFDPARKRDAAGAVGSLATGKFPNAAQRRRAAVLRSLNLDNGFAPGSAFQIATICAADNPLPS